MQNDFNVIRFWLAELVAFLSFGVSLSMVNQVLQAILLTVGIASACIALYEGIKKRKK